MQRDITTWRFDQSLPANQVCITTEEKESDVDDDLR